MLDSACDTADGTIPEILVYLNRDDSSLVEYEKFLPTVPHSRKISVFVGNDQPTNMSWNQMATRARGDLLMVCGDDVEFKTKGWDTKLKAAVPEDGWAILSVNDGRGGKDSHPHPIYTRKIYEALNYVMWPGYLHWGGDVFAAELGKRLGRHIWLEDVLVEHQKPSDHGIVDDTHQRIRKGWMPDRDQFVLQHPATQRALDAEVKYIQGLMAEEWR